MSWLGRGGKGYIGFIAAVLAVAAVTVGLAFAGDHVNSTTAALVYLLAVILIASVYESPAALLASLLAALSINYLFLAPYYTLTISDPENWVALFVFLAVAVTVGQLSARANRRADEARKLYKDLEQAFEKASEAEALKRSEKLKSALLDAVTHDLRTPLTSIKASVTMLIDENQNDPIHTTLDPAGRGDLLAVINEETDRLNSFVESMVEIARIQSGDPMLRRSPVTAEEIVVKAAQRAKAIRRTHKLRSDIAPGLPMLSIDPRAIVEVLFNLLDNAAKYSPAGTRILIAVARSDEGVRFSVEDEGSGVPEAEREAVFERFYRKDRSARGLGMGLSIVRGIIEAHLGSIWVESGNKGARFVFDLPLNANER
jgi:K+-sensing histidine kinase KdpD